MKKLQLPVLLVLITLFITFYLPWFLIPIAFFVMGYLYLLKPLNAFLLGLTTSGVTWLILAYLTNSKGAVSVTEIISSLLGNISSSMVYLITGLSIGLVSGLAMASGRLVNQSRANNGQS